jgi:protoporphyrin/coproporphyrin ferrochelatase
VREQVDQRIGVLLMAMGGPDSLAAVGPYLHDVRGGRPTPPELIEEITERYRRTGGKSPVLAITQELAGKLEERLRAAGLTRCGVYVGLRHWHPFIGETFSKMLTDGVRRMVGVCMAPQNSQMSVGAYINKVEEARAQSSPPVSFTYVASWNTHPILMQAIAANIAQTLTKFPADAREQVPIVFTAHSLPARILRHNDPYPREVQETVEAVAARIRPHPWRLAYQSQGRSEEPWLGPGMEEVLEELHGLSHRHVLIAPVGFVSDHVEILYDIDIEAKNLAGQKGMRLERIPMLNATVPLVETLSDVITTHLKETAS